MFRAVALVTLALAGGCRDERLAELESIRDDVCACKTPACGEAAMKRVPQDEVPADHRAQRVAKAMLDCLSKLYLESKPADDEAATP